MVAPAGGGVMEASWSANRVASDAITKVRIRQILNNVLSLDELPMILVVAMNDEK